MGEQERVADKQQQQQQQRAVGECRRGREGERESEREGERESTLRHIFITLVNRKLNKI